MSRVLTKILYAHTDAFNNPNSEMYNPYTYKFPEVRTQVVAPRVFPYLVSSDSSGRASFVNARPVAAAASTPPIQSVYYSYAFGNAFSSFLAR